MSEQEHIPEEIQIRSEEVQEILSFVPNWMIRWGNSLILILIMGLLLISWFVKYPDTIAANILVTTSNPPEKIYAKTDGQIDVILVDDNDLVTTDKLLAVIENTSNYKDVLLLKNTMDTLNIDYNNFYFPIEKLPILFLGDIEADYAMFERSYAEYKLSNELQPFSNEALANQLSINEAESRFNILSSQQRLNREELKLKKKDVERFETLYQKGVV